MTSADVKFSHRPDTARRPTGWGYIDTAIKQVDAVNP